ncbi:GlxA family transcriptional regulator [Paenarthrobacter sp. GOM3]|uniref:GlxA family transcriptional regulator n=1 Tax=Paenarthrobacter sp. GOM3 TaxID=2782567 RepID=UPI001BA6F487|nr:GlxA family transcriptional regulator [Paenarthrobacter sp. GOM3]WOH20511.1 GlxA family transcriptional regulator [Paenarthrobacter sp. GOM3]
MGHSHTIAFLVFDGVKMLDVAGPAEVFAEANKLGARYSLTYLSPSGDPVSTSIGLPLPVDSDSSQLTRMDTLVVPGGDDLPSKPIPTELVDAVQSLHRRSQRLVAICTGAFILAKAGILDHRQATTHWEHARLLAAAYPDIRVRPDSLFVADGEVFTSAGVSAGIDLALALVERDHGASIARLIAQRLVLFMQRPGGQSQFSAPLSIETPKNEPLRKAVELIAARPNADYSLGSLARLMGLSTRQVARLFAAELNTSPAKFVEQMRLDHAKAMLADGRSITKTATAAGFGSPETMRRIFNQRLRASPSEYRARFHAARVPDEVKGQLQPS